MLEFKKISDDTLEVMKKSIKNVKDFHEKQVRNSWITTREDGVILGQRITPLDNVGVYVPGGKAPLSSSVIMNIIPAKVAGVREIIMATPPGADGKESIYPCCCKSFRCNQNLQSWWCTGDRRICLRDGIDSESRQDYRTG